MFLRSIARAEPRTVLRQAESFELLVRSGALDSLKPRSRGLLEKILLGDSGIETRRFVEEDPSALTGLDAGALAATFEKHAPGLACEALARACERGSVRPAQIDALLICTCTGYLCPGLTSHVAERLGLRPGAFLQDLLGLGCGAAIPMLQAAKGVCVENPNALVATVAVEICSAAFFVCDDPGVLISLCLFGDGAAAALWQGRGDDDAFRMQGFRTIHRPEHREKIRFVNDGGRLKNQLARDVPDLAAEAVAELFSRRSVSSPDHVLSHTGGRDVLDAIEARLGNTSLDHARAILRDNGNVSSPSVLLALERAWEPDPGARTLWLTAFGAGFAAHSCELVR